MQAMRKTSFQPKIYNHRLKTLAKENGFEEQTDLFFSVYERLLGCINAGAFYEYDYPARGYVSCVLTMGAGPVLLKEKLPSAEDEARIFDILIKEFETELIRLFGEHVNRETRQSIGQPALPGEDEQLLILGDLKDRWPDLPPLADGAALLCGSAVFQAKTGRRVGCSGGGACTQCTHPTCGKAPG